MGAVRDASGVYKDAPVQVRWGAQFDGFVCPICDALYDDQATLDAHVRRLHVNDGQVAGSEGAPRGVVSSSGPAQRDGSTSPS